MNWLIFDIETVPDVALGRRLLGIDPGLDDAAVAKAMAFRRLQEADTEFLPLHQHRIVAISVLLRSRDGLKLWSLGTPESDEAELIRRFFDGLDHYVPELVSWNGGGFDLPVLHYRALRHGITARTYWETGDEQPSFRYNNYLARFHWRHVDLMDVLSGYQPRARARLDEIAVMLGFPGKTGLRGDQVWDRYLAGGIGEIRDYCETDVLNTYLVWLRFQQLRGVLDASGVAAEHARLREYLAGESAAHLRGFLADWDAGAA